MKQIIGGKYSGVIFYILFLMGIIINITLSSTLLSSELEARANIRMNGDGDLGISCPLLMSDNEDGDISATILNNTSETALPYIMTQLSRGSMMDSSNERVTISPSESIEVKRSVNSSNIMYSHFIFASITQQHYGEMDSNQGICGIFILNLFALSGRRSLLLILIISFSLILSSIFILLKRYFPVPSEFIRKLAQASGAFLVFSLIGLVAAIFRYWALTLVFNAVSIITLVAIFTDVILPGDSKR